MVFPSLPVLQLTSVTILTRHIKVSLMPDMNPCVPMMKSLVLQPMQAMATLQAEALNYDITHPGSYLNTSQTQWSCHSHQAAPLPHFWLLW